MSLQSILYTRLTTHVGTNALIALRARPNGLEQNETYPAISFQMISEDRRSAMGADIGIVHARWQIDCWDQDDSSGAGYDGAKALAEQVRQALQRWTNASGPKVFDTFLINAAEIPEPVIDISRVSLDFMFHHTE